MIWFCSTRPKLTSGPADQLSLVHIWYLLYPQLTALGFDFASSCLQSAGPETEWTQDRSQTTGAKKT